LYWGGWDPDGEVAYYEYIITNNETGIFDPADTTSTPGDYKWNRVDSHDSTFVFSADQIPDSNAIDFGGAHGPEEFRRSHTFFIRAVDEVGSRSTTPAYRSFTARTLSPTVFVRIPTRSLLNPAEVPPITTFQWTATDFVDNVAQIQEPDSVRWILVKIARFSNDWDSTLAYIRNNPHAPEWSDWHYYRAPGDTGKFWTSPPLDFGFYYFAVQAMDEAGAVSPVFDLNANLRRIVVGPRNSGPILTVVNEFIGTILTASPSTPPTIIDLPAGVPMAFEFEASGEHYGGLVSGYRYGWDILDLNDDSQWEIDFTPFIGDRARSPGRTFFFGTHSFFVEVTDNSGFKSRVEIRVNIVPFTMENDLLFVDDWFEGTSATCFRQNSGTSPCDAENDEFWNYVLGTVKGFNPNTDTFELGVGGRNELPIQVLARYKNIIWNATGNTTGSSAAFLDELISFKDPDGATAGGKTQPNLVALYMAAGGHVLLVGNRVMTLAINPVTMQSIVFPLIFRYELQGDQDGVYTDPNNVGVFGVGEQSFAYRECCLNVLDQSSLQNINQIRRPGSSEDSQRCPVNLIRDNSRVRDGMRSALPIDVSTGPGFPRLDLRPSVSGPGKFHEFAGLVVDIYNPSYFTLMTACGGVTETIPQRECYEPIFGNGCANPSSLHYNAHVAFWTSVFVDRVPDVPGAVGARSAVWGFHPVYFNPDQVRDAVGVIVHDEWQLERN